MLSPIEAVTHPDPYPYYATLVAQRPLHFDDGLQMWIAADAATVTALLGSQGCRVRPPAEPVPKGIIGTPAGEVFGRLVRMTDGELQQRLKRLIVTALSSVRTDTVAALTADRVAKTLKAAGPTSYSELMFSVPAQVVAALCGLDPDEHPDVSRLVGEFVMCIPASATPQQQAAAARAAAALQELLGPRLDRAGDGLLGELVRAAVSSDWHDTAPLLANGIGLLSQTYDATAGLIGNTLVALGRHGRGRPRTPAELGMFVREVARHDAPVQNTRRFTAQPVQVVDTEIGAGEAILLLLAAANRDPSANPDPAAFRPDRAVPAMFTFGSGTHRCPGETLAIAIAAAVLWALLTHGADLAEVPAPVAYRPSGNARIPVLDPPEGATP
jgi:cytochrome P450